MSILRPYLSLIIMILFFIIILIIGSISFSNINISNNFLNSNLFIALVTFLVGTLAVYLYIKQKNDFKRDAASIILMEIRNAERVIDELNKRIDIGVQQLILPTNNWSKYNYLFIKNLDRDELDLINNFYNQSSLIDKSLDQMSLSRQLETKSQSIHSTLVQLAKESISKPDYDLKRNHFLDITIKEDFTFMANAPKHAVESALNNLSKISTSTAGQKLKLIARMD